MNASLKAPRIQSVDALRGFALAGVALVHMLEQYTAGPVAEALTQSLNQSIADSIVQGLVGFLFIGKFFALFSILFGLSFSIQMRSAERKGERFAMRFLWRAILLFGIGYVHQLFYRGDILTIYAVLVPFLIPVYPVKNKWILLLAAIFLFSLPRMLIGPLLEVESLFNVPSFSEGEHPFNQAYSEAVQNGSILDVFAQNANFGMRTKMAFQFSLFGRIFTTLGYFYFGLWLGKMDVFRKIEDWLPKTKKVLLWTLGFIVMGVITAFILFSFAQGAPDPETGARTPDFDSPFAFIGFNFFDWANIGLTLMILTTFLFLYHRKIKWQSFFDFFAPYGRMALTNYILQSVIGTYLLFGWGLGLIGKLPAIALFGIALVLIVVQSLFSRWWLSKFKYGPLEWLWRSLTYFKAQPFVREG
ncbi:MAG: DUF418 domain-containing protein [Bacteroidota bacterium]